MALLEVIHLQVPLQIPCSRAPHVAMRRGLYHHPTRLASEPGVQSLRVPMFSIGLPCGLSAPRDCYRDSVLEDPRSSPHIARFVPVPYGSGVATQFTT